MEVKFISYTGSYPALCSGTLTLEIDGVEYNFGPAYRTIEPLPIFWASGGHCYCDEDREGTTHNAWRLVCYEKDRKKLEEKFGAGCLEKFIEVMNENVEHGCCGGCI